MTLGNFSSLGLNEAVDVSQLSFNNDKGNHLFSEWTVRCGGERRCLRQSKIRRFLGLSVTPAAVDI